MASKNTAAANKSSGKNEEKGKGKQELAKTQDQLPANIDMSQYAGAGMENTDRDSFAIPFLAIMQKGSPQVDKDSDAYVEGAEVGDLMLTTTQEIFKDEDGVDIVFCGYRRAFLRWAPRDQGGGFKGELAVDEVAAARANGSIREEDGKLFADDGDLIRDTRIHYVMVVRPDGSFTPAVISCSSTQIKKSKMLMTQLQTYRANGPNGSYNPPTFAHIFHAETVAESNDQGNWRGWKFSRVSFVASQQLFQACAKFSESVVAGAVRADMEHADTVNTSSRSSDDRNGF